MKKLLAILLTAAMILAVPATVYADEYDAGNEAAFAEEAAQPDADTLLFEQQLEEHFREREMLLESTGDDDIIESGDWQYEVVGGKASLRYYEGTNMQVTVPSKIDGYTVTTLGEDLFFESDITSVTIPDTVTKIDEYVFYGCTKLTSIKWSSKIKSIGQCAFCECTKMKTMEIPSSVTSIGEYAFKDMASLTSVTIPKAVTEIGLLAFAENYKLQEINYNATECPMSDSTFRGAGKDSKSLTLNIGKGVVTVPAWLFYVGDSDSDMACVTEVNFSSTVTGIGSHAFDRCKYLTKIKLPDNLEYIEEGAFANCTSLKSVLFPKKLDYIADYAFWGCTSLKTISFSSGINIVYDAFPDCPNIEKAYFFGKDTEVTESLLDASASNVTVYCYKNSYADDMAKNHSLNIVYLTRSSYFPDVPPDHSYQKAVYWACDEGIAAGFKNGTFGVADDITRGQVVMFLWRLAGKPDPKKTTQTFNDVPTTHNYYKAIQWANEKGIAAGYKSGKFGVNDNCTRGQIVTFLWRYKKKPNPSSMEQKFKDVPTTHNYFKPIQWASEKNIAAGYSNGTFKPQNTCTRGQCVTFLYRMAH